MPHLLLPVGALAWVNAMRPQSLAERDAIAAALQLAITLSAVPAGGYPRGTLARIQAQVPLLYQHLRLHASSSTHPFPNPADSPQKCAATTRRLPSSLPMATPVFC